MKNCHYIKSKGIKILIPECWGTVHSENMKDCYCEMVKELKQTESKHNQELKQTK